MDSQPYPDRLKKYEKDSGLTEAVVCGTGTIHGIPVSLAVMDFRFCGGSMGSGTGEKITRAIEMALDEKIPCIIISAAGGARMQEGIFSLMQMAKTSAALGRLAAARLPFISILTDPTTGGVTASFATLGDVILAEPGALIGFAGAVVIKETTKQTLPAGFQTGRVSAQARPDRPDRQPARDARPAARHPAGAVRQEEAARRQRRPDGSARRACSASAISLGVADGPSGRPFCQARPSGRALPRASASDKGVAWAGHQKRDAGARACSTGAFSWKTPGRSPPMPRFRNICSASRPKG